MNKQEQQFAASTANIEGFYAPWTKGARHSYAAADTFEAAKAGFKRKRSNQMFMMTNSGVAGSIPCVSCGNLLRNPAARGENDSPLNPKNKAETHSTWMYDAKTKKVSGGQHYPCSWMSIMTTISEIHSY